MKIFQAFDSDTAKNIIDSISESEWVDGKKSATGGAASKKNNFQIPHTSETFSKVRPLLARALNNPTVLSYTYMRSVVDPRLAKYGIGNEYGWHVDAALIANARTDLSFTVFLNAKDEYDGGELIIKRDNNDVAVEAKPGQMVIYPSGLLHKVNPVTSGTRYVIVGWINSNVKMEEHRQRLFALKLQYSRLLDKQIDPAELDILNQTFNSMLRDYSS